MKLIPARCPSCGAEIEVNKKNETTKCKYCDTRIIIDDAIAKYKLELSGKVTVENLPTITNLLKIGTRHIEQKEYSIAQEKLQKALELDADNAESIIKECLSRVAVSSATETGLNKLLSSFKTAKEFCTEEQLDEYVMFCINHLDNKRRNIKRALDYRPEKYTFYKLKTEYVTYMNFYEKVLNKYITIDKNKQTIIKNIFACIQCYKMDGEYTDFDYTTGTDRVYKFLIDKEFLKYLNKKIEFYQEELAKVDPEYNLALQQRRLDDAAAAAKKQQMQLELQQRRKETINKFLKSPFSYIDVIAGVVLFIFLVACMIAMSEKEVSIPPLFILALLLCTPISIFSLLELLNLSGTIKKVIQNINNLTLKNKIIITSIKDTILIIILIIEFVLLLSNAGNPKFVAKAFVNNYEQVITFIDNNKLTIEENSEVKEYNYTYVEKKENIYFIKLLDESNNIITNIKYHYYSDSNQLCYLAKDDTCLIYYNQKDAK